MLAAGLPLALLLALEAGLRLFSYGHSASFFLKADFGGRRVFIENQDFAKRYFPPGLARSPQPLVLPAEKAPGTVRIFVFGESAAMGDPEPSFGLPRMLETLLRARHPDRRFEVVNVAATAINSHVVRHIARDCARRQGDVWIVYMGNNEVVGPFGAGTVFGAQTPGLGFIRASLAIKATRAGQFLDSIRHRLLRPTATPANWEGMEMFLKQQIPASDPRMARVHAHFRRNLEDLLNLGRAAGAKLIVSTVAANLKDCPPFGSMHRAGLADATLAEWDKAFRAGVDFETRSNHLAALEQYQQAARLDDDYAELHFRLGRCLRALGRLPAARASFAKALDLDTLRFRADSTLNQIVREAADGRAPARLLDAAELLAKASPDGLLGDEFLFEHVHLNFAGNHFLARALAAEVDALLTPTDGAAAAQGQWLTVEECARRLAWTDFDRHQLTEEMLKRLQQPPFTGQLDHASREQRWQQRLAESRAALRPEALAAAAEIYRQALARASDDWVLHDNFAKLLQAAGDTPGAEREWHKVTALAPHYAPAHYSLGNLLAAQGRSDEAVRCFEDALRWRPGSIEALNGLGLTLASQGKSAEAAAQYRSALRQKPGFAEARVNLGQLLASQGQVAEAMAEYAAVLRQDSNHAAAHVNLGKLLAAQGRTADARAHYEAAVRANPGNAVAHYNLGNALITGGQADAALPHFAEAVRLKPDFAEARYNLGLELARQQRTAEAVEQFSEAVRLKPQFVEGRLNLGVALAQARRYAEAREQFQAVLQLAPGHPTARQYLEQVRALENQPGVSPR